MPVSTYCIENLLAYGQQVLSSTSDSAKLDSQILLSFVLSKSITYLLTWPQQFLADEQQQHFFALIKKRQQGEPVAYLIGKKAFWSLELAVSPATLIPRPDTEILVELVLEHYPNENLALLDLGTGTGAIALALASEKLNWQIDAVDFNADAVKLANYNAITNKLTQLNIYQSDWYLNIPANKKFDVIVSNPPYIAADDHHLTEGDVRFEPLSALVAERDGYADIEHIIEQAKNFLNANGRVYIEHGFEQGLQVRTFFAKYRFINIVTERDFGGNERITYAQLK